MPSRSRRTSHRSPTKRPWPMPKMDCTSSSISSRPPPDSFELSLVVPRGPGDGLIEKTKYLKVSGVHCTASTGAGITRNNRLTIHNCRLRDVGGTTHKQTQSRGTVNHAQHSPMSTLSCSPLYTRWLQPTEHASSSNRACIVVHGGYSMPSSSASVCRREKSLARSGWACRRSCAGDRRVGSGTGVGSGRGGR